MKPTVGDLNYLLEMTPETSIIERVNIQSHIDSRNAHPFAEFHSWQKSHKGDALFPLFAIIGGECDGSTVGIPTLERLEIDVPDFPPYEVKP